MLMRLSQLAVALAAAALLVLPLPAAAQTALLSGKTESCAEQQQAYTPIQQRYERGVIFRVEKCGYAGSYIMGTMHSDSTKLAPIFSDAQAILKGLKGVGFEFVEDEQTAATAQQYMLLPTSYAQGLRDMIPPADYQRLEDALAERVKLPRPFINRMRPWAAAVTLQYPVPTTDGITLDVRLQQRAKAMQKTLFGLETPAEQFRIFDRMPFDKQLVMLQDSIAGIADIDKHNAEFMQAYISRDLKALHKLADESFAMTSDAELRDYLRENLLTARNHTMAERMQPRLRAGNVLIAIGALHLMGDEGILPLLEKDGWRIEVVR